MKVLNFFGFIILMVLHFKSYSTFEVEKRYLAALAKNGRLPKFADTQKKDSAEFFSIERSFPNGIKVDEYPKDSLMEKKNIGAFLKSHGKPNFQNSRESKRKPEVDYLEDSNNDDKRNVASLARLGKLNAIRYGRYPYDVGEKRVFIQEKAKNYEKSDNDEDNEINALEDPDCYEVDDEENEEVKNDENSNWKKRYVAALARSGRLPIWHPQRIWYGGKRYDSRPYWSDSDVVNDDNNENTINEAAFVGPKSKKCKTDDYLVEEKKNIRALARDGKLPNYYGKRNIAALARDGKLRASSSDKRNIAALARDGKLLMSSGEKRNIAALARNGKLPMSSNEKRNIAALARNGKLPMSSSEKRNIAALARDGKLPGLPNA